MAFQRKERVIVAASVIAVGVIVLATTSEYFTPNRPPVSMVYQLILITLAGNWNPVPDYPNLNAVTAALALLMNLGALGVLFRLFQFLSDQKERNMKAIDLLEIFDHLVTAKVSSDVAKAFNIEGDADQLRLNKVVSDAVKNTKALWQKTTVPNMLKNPTEIEKFQKSLEQKY